MDERSLRVGVSFDVVGMDAGEIAFERGILLPQRGVLPECVTKRKLVAPKAARPAHHVYLMRSRRPATEVVPAGNPERALVLVAELPERGDVFRAIGARRTAGEDIDDWLGVEARHGGAPDVLEPDRQPATGADDARFLCRIFG